jgi:L-ribulokinase
MILNTSRKVVDDAFVIGVDFGTDSVRTIIVNASTGEQMATATFHYPRWRDGLFCDPQIQQYRQHPLDYIEGLEFTIKKCISIAGSTVAANIKAISVDTTGSTPVAVNKDGIPLSLTHGFLNNPNAMFVLWKDHTAVKEADEINEKAKQFPENYLQFVGGIYSSEWYWAKLLHILRSDGEVKNACAGWVEHCDWIPFLLTRGSNLDELKRSVCAAGHKALWHNSFDGLPKTSFFEAIDPLLVPFTKSSFEQVCTSDKAVGFLDKFWAQKLGLTTDVIIGVGAFDAHMGAVGGQIEPYYLSKVIGTSTCDILITPEHDLDQKVIKGICGQVVGSVVPGMIGLEAGQSAFGDVYAWFKRMISSSFFEMIAQSTHISDNQKKDLQKEIDLQLIPFLLAEAEKISLAENYPTAIDWLNGRRTPDANQYLQGAISGLTLGTTAPHIFRSLVEATCFGAKKIVDRFAEEGIPIKGVIALGGVANKSPFIMQMLADLLGMPIRVHNSEQTCAIGASMFAATAAGLHNNIEEAMQRMGQGFQKVYAPNKLNHSFYEKKYDAYKKLGQYAEQYNV